MPSVRLLRVAVTADGPDLARLAADTAPDVVVLHGAPSTLRWRSKSAALARRAGLVVVGGGRTAGGNLLLSTLGVDVLAVRDVAFGRAPLAPGAVLAALRREGGAFALAGVRVGERDRARDLARVRAGLDELMPGGSLPAVVAGDLPDADGLQRVADGVLVGQGATVGDVVATGAGAVLVEIVLPD